MINCNFYNDMKIILKSANDSILRHAIKHSCEITRILLIKSFLIQ